MIFQRLRQFYLGCNFDNAVNICIISIIALGILTLSSVAGLEVLSKHLTYLGLGFITFIIGYKLDLELLRKYSWIVYSLGIILLILVAVIGTTSLGAQRWLYIGPVSIQPSEVAKLSCIIFLAYILSRGNNPTKDFNIPKIIIYGCLVMLLPFALIITQPDLGTSIILIVLFATMIYWAGARLANILIIYNPMILIVIGGIGPSIIYAPYISISYISLIYLVLVHAYFWKQFNIQRNNIQNIALWIGNFLASLFIINNLRLYLWNLLEPYQQKRISIFLNPYIDPEGAGYNIIQSLTATASGQLFGQGYKQGLLTQGNFVPEQHTDFIFTGLAEEFGFFGVFILLNCFAVICFRLVKLAYKTPNKFHKLLIIGILTYIGFHVCVNIAMNIGLMPITGIPLPLMSYGGTALCINLFCLGIIQNIHSRIIKY